MLPLVAPPTKLNAELDAALDGVCEELIAPLLAFPELCALVNVPPRIIPTPPLLQEA